MEIIGGFDAAADEVVTEVADTHGRFCEVVFIVTIIYKQSLCVEKLCIISIFAVERDFKQIVSGHDVVPVQDVDMLKGLQDEKAVFIVDFFLNVKFVEPPLKFLDVSFLDEELKALFVEHVDFLFIPFDEADENLKFVLGFQYLLGFSFKISQRFFCLGQDAFQIRFRFLQPFEVESGDILKVAVSHLAEHLVFPDADDVYFRPVDERTFLADRRKRKVAFLEQEKCVFSCEWKVSFQGDLFFSAQGTFYYDFFLHKG